MDGIITTEFGDLVSANGWIEQAKLAPVPQMLFGEYWLENEIAVLFGDTGVGKSVLAIQIAEAVARGKRVSRYHPFAGRKGSVFGEVETTAQSVIYLDFELTAKQFEMRYSRDKASNINDSLRFHYTFAKGLSIFRPDLAAMDTGDERGFEARLRRSIEHLAEQTGSRVLIVDNITFLMRRGDRSSEAAPMMKELKRIKDKLGLSILIVAHTSKRDRRQPLSINDMQGSKVISDFADSVFAIGRSGQCDNERYIVSIKQRSGKTSIDRATVPVFELKKIRKHFLGLSFSRFAAESQMLVPASESLIWQTIRSIKELRDEGRTVRDIAKELGISKSSVGRYLQIWQKDPFAPKPPPMTANERANARFTYDKKDPNDFPGRETYEQMREDLYESDKWDTQTEEAVFLRHECDLLYAAESESLQHYKQHGVPMAFDDHTEYEQFVDEVWDHIKSDGAVTTERIQDVLRRAGYSGRPSLEETTSETPPAVFSPEDLHGPQACPFYYDKTDAAKRWREFLIARNPDRQRTDIVHDYSLGEEWCRPPGSRPPLNPDDPFENMSHELDHNDQPIYVESHHEDGRPKVYYNYNSAGRLQKWTRDHNGSSGSEPNPNFFGKWLIKPQNIRPSVMTI